MNLFFKLFSFIVLSLVITLESHSISNSQIIRICNRERRAKACVKKLKLKRELIKKGKPIEIPVYPYKYK
tara:strand:+ start:518 stop:727 length:210 start_codon:yes stop_codon:yes gene_type:complete